jgi:hypothetical protein
VVDSFIGMHDVGVERLLRRGDAPLSHENILGLDLGVGYLLPSLSSHPSIRVRKVVVGSRFLTHRHHAGVQTTSGSFVQTRLVN